MRPRKERRRWAVLAAATGTMLIAAGAFWLSFTALADLAGRSGIAGEQAWIWPLLVDGLIVVATIAVVALDGHRTAWYPWALLIAGAGASVTANAIHAVVTADTDVPALLAAAVAAVPPLVLLASTHLTVVLTRGSTTPPATEPTTTDDMTEPSPASPAVPATAITVEPPVSQLDPDPARAQLTAGHDGPAEIPPPEPATDATAGSAGDAPHAVRPKPAPERPQAEPDRRTRAERLREAGWSNKAIARELGVHASTVGRWFPRTTPLTPTPITRKKEPDHEPPRE